MRQLVSAYLAMYTKPLKKADKKTDKDKLLVKEGSAFLGSPSDKIKQSR